jgi:hypothetical protein
MLAARSDIPKSWRNLARRYTDGIPQYSALSFEL